MPSPSVTYTFSNNATADASQVNQNFTDVINALTDASKDLSIAALTVSGNFSATGSTLTLGNASSDTLTVTASLGSHLVPSTDATYDLGSAAIGYRALYLGAGSGLTVKIAPGAVAGDITLTTGTATGTIATLAGTETFTNKTLTSPNVNEAVALTTTATKLNYLTSATGTTGTTSTNIVFSTSPTLVTPTLGAATATSLTISGSITQTTSDGNDNSSVNIHGGGGTSSTRGAQINIHGNEHASYPGQVAVFCGTEQTGTEVGFVVGDSGGVTRFTVAANGTCALGAASGYTINHALNGIVSTIGDGTSDIRNIGATDSSEATLSICKDRTEAASEIYVYFREGANSGSVGSAVGGIRRNAGDTAYEFFNVSDARHKENIRDWDSDALVTLTNLRVRNFEWKATPGYSCTGFIAQEVAEAIPEMVAPDANGVLNIGYSSLYPYLVKAIQQLKLEIDKLKAR